MVWLVSLVYFLVNSPKIKSIWSSSNLIKRPKLQITKKLDIFIFTFSLPKDSPPLLFVHIALLAEELQYYSRVRMSVTILL